MFGFKKAEKLKSKWIEYPLALCLHTFYGNNKYAPDKFDTMRWVESTYGESIYDKENIDEVRTQFVDSYKMYTKSKYKLVTVMCNLFIDIEGAYHIQYECSDGSPEKQIRVRTYDEGKHFLHNIYLPFRGDEFDAIITFYTNRPKLLKEFFKQKAKSSIDYFEAFRKANEACSTGFKQRMTFRLEVDQDREFFK